MKQAIQQSVENKLPIKTKIATLWVILTGLIILFMDGLLYIPKALRVLPINTRTGEIIYIILIYIIFPLIELIIVISAFYLLKQKKWAWFIFVVGNFGLTFFSGFAIYRIDYSAFLFMIPLFHLFPRFVCSLIPLILVLFDRKNFFKIAS